MIAHLSWAEVKHYTNNITLHDMSSSFDTLLEDLDTKYIAIAIVRERGFVELLEQERQERDGRSGMGTTPLDGTPRTDRDSALSRISSGLELAERWRRRESRDSGYFPDMLEAVPSLSAAAKAFDMGSEPLTPRSEAAAGQMFQNAAVKRTRRSPPLFGTPAPALKSTGASRLQFEAAWNWIDEHIEDYVDKLANLYGLLYKSKRVLWDELVALRKRKEELEKSLKGNSEA